MMLNNNSYRDGTGRDFVPELLLTVCTHNHSILGMSTVRKHEITSSDSLSVHPYFSGTCVHGNGKEKCRYICVREYKSGLPR